MRLNDMVLAYQKIYQKLIPDLYTLLQWRMCYETPNDSKVGHAVVVNLKHQHKKTVQDFSRFVQYLKKRNQFSQTLRAALNEKSFNCKAKLFYD